MTQTGNFRAYMKAVNRTSGNNEPHLSGSQMIAYCRGELSAAEHESAEAHLAGCEPCVDLFRSARDFLEPAGTDETEVTAAETDKAWQALSQRMKIQGAKTAGHKKTVVAGDFARARDRRVSVVTLALAASLVVSLGALGWLIWRITQERQARQQSQELARQSDNRQRELEQRLAELQRNEADQLSRERERRLAAEAERDQLQSQLAGQLAREDAPVYVARLTSERGAEAEVKLHLTSVAPALKLQLLISKPYEFPEYAIELFDERGQIVQRISRVRPSGDAGALNVRLNRAALRAGKYKLRLLGRRGEAEQQLGDYALAVTVGR